MKRIIGPRPSYLKDLFVDYISIDIYDNRDEYSFSHNSKLYTEYATHYNILFDLKNKPMKHKIGYQESFANFLPILMSRE